MAAFSGVGPSPGAATPAKGLAIEASATMDHADIAVVEDGHTPLNRCGNGFPRLPPPRSVRAEAYTHANFTMAKVTQRPAKVLIEKIAESIAKIN